MFAIFEFIRQFLLKKTAYKKFKKQELNGTICFRDYKYGHVLENTNRDKRDYKCGQFNGFQIGAKGLKNWATISNQGKEISNWD